MHKIVIILLSIIIYWVFIITINAQKLLPDPEHNECGVDAPDKIFEGNETDIDEYPWTALIGYVKKNENSKVFGCVGSLISNRYVVSSAHCVRHPYSKSMFVRLGEWNIDTTTDCNQNLCNDPPVDVGIEEVVFHEGFNSRSNDIALLRLLIQVAFSATIRPICLPLSWELHQRSDHHQQNYVIVGWGRQFGKKAKMELPGMSLENCNKIYGDPQRPIGLSDKHLCAGGGKETCPVDILGSLIGVFGSVKGVRYNYLAGVQSFGTSDCNEKPWSEVFTNVGEYVDWIQDNIWP